MIVVVGRVVTDADKRADLMRVGQAVAAASRLEPGCTSYRLYQDTQNENEFVFVEEWESDEALQQHFASSHVGEFLQAIRATHGGTAALDIIDPDRTLRFDRPVLDPQHYYESRQRMTAALSATAG